MVRSFTQVGNGGDPAASAPNGNARVGGARGEEECTGALRMGDSICYMLLNPIVQQKWKNVIIK